MVVVHGKKCEDGKGRRHLGEIRNLASARGLELVEVRTEREGHCEELVRDASFDDIDAVGVMGGDGTFREGVCGMIARGGGDASGGKNAVPIFAFPCGTGNNYARDLGQRTVADVFDAIARGHAHAVDAVRVQHPNGMTYSINCVTWGMARDAAATAEHMRWLGAIRYDVAGFFHIMKNKLNYARLAAYDGEVTSSSVEHVSDSSEANEDYLMIFAQNTRCSGRGFPFTPLAKLDDGAFDVIAVKKCGALKTVGLFEAVKNGGSHVRDPSVCYVKVKKATLEARDSADLVGIDGEVDVATPIHLEIAEGAFKTFV